MNNPKNIRPQLAQEASEQAVQETPSKLQGGFSLLDEKQLGEVVGTRWPLGLPGVQEALARLKASTSRAAASSSSKSAPSSVHPVSVTPPSSPGSHLGSGHYSPPSPR